MTGTRKGSWRTDGHPHMRDEDGTCHTCGATKGQHHGPYIPPLERTAEETDA